MTVVNDSAKRIQLRLVGTTPSLTSGRVLVFGRGEPAPTIASAGAGIVWVEAAKENLLILPEQGEWAALAALSP